jgi:hypothetical protein
MPKLTDAAVLILLMTDSPNVRMSWYDPMRPVGMASPVRGHGTKANPPGRSIFKLISDGLIAGREHAELSVTPAGRKVLAELYADGWTLVTGTGHKPRAERKTSA